MSFLHLAFFMGLFGSLHCVAMCGPLMLAIPASGKGYWKELTVKLLYQVGRVLTYMCLGYLLGYIGTLGSAIKNGQQWITWITGIALLLAGISHFIPINKKGFYQMQQRLFQPFFKRIGFWLHKSGGHFFAGMLNGLLPCGMVYMALASALSATTAVGGAFFMGMFGLGTIPLLLVFTFAGALGKSRLRFSFNRWLPALFIIMGLWFLLRASNMDIPFLSPLIYPEGAIYCNW